MKIETMRPFILLASCLFFVACSTQPSNEQASEGNDAPKSAFEEGADLPPQEEVEINNPPAQGFDAEGSDPIAIIIADKVMNAMGGRQAWDSTRFITWNFFGARKLLWDKQTGNVRIDNLSDDRIVLMNVNDMTGRVFKNGQELVSPDSLEQYLDWGNRVWINDSYWLVMPFKLKDSGVTLTYKGTSQTWTGEEAEKLHLSFQNVGVTPENGYDVWVSKETDLVTQWSYYPNETDSLPRFSLPWGEYFKTGGIMLSTDRGERDLSDVRVLTEEELPEGIFESFDVTL